MDAIILAAGRGSRLRALTAEQPKPLTRLAGKPLLEWQLAALRAAGIQQITLITGYANEMLEPYADQRLYNPHWSSSNMVRSLMRADELLSRTPLLICYGDIVYRSQIIRDLAASSASLAITYDTDWWELWSARFDDPLADAESFQLDHGQLLNIGQRVKDRALIEGQYMGLLKFTPVGWRQVREWLDTLTSAQIDKLDMTSLLQSLLQQGVVINTVPVKGGWVEVDNPSDIVLYEQKIIIPGWGHDWR